MFVHEFSNKVFQINSKKKTEKTVTYNSNLNQILMNISYKCESSKCVYITLLKMKYMNNNTQINRETLKSG